MGLLESFGIGVREEVKEIRVLDQDFNNIQLITDHTILSEVNACWEKREEVSLEYRPAFEHNLDIILEDGRSTRWLYDTEGYVTVLTKVKKPIYQFADPQQLKTLLIPEYIQDEK